MPRRIDSVLLLDKPLGITSNRALQQAKRLLGAAKAGHSGTLDPLASGLLPVLFGEATKFSRFLLDSDKTYEGDVHLGVSTTSGDAEGEVVDRRPVAVSDTAIEQALTRFRGELMQVPPMHSALKRGGRPLYALAREGTLVAREPRPIVIHALQVLGREGNLLRLRVTCSKGTYLRTLAEDIGHALGTGAHLAALRRTGAGPFAISQAVTLESLAATDAAERDRLLVPMERLVESLPALHLERALVGKFLNGQPVPQGALALGRYRVYDPGGALLGVGETGAAGVLRPVRLLAQSAGSSQAAEIPRKSL